MRDPDDPILRHLLERCRRDHDSWINGDGSPYSLPVDGTILGAVGGFASGGTETVARQVAVARQWESGHGTVEFLNGCANDDVAWLVMLERASVRIAEQLDPRRWDLRVTEVFRRLGDDWERVHRHADPLVDRHDLAVLLDLLEPS